MRRAAKARTAGITGISGAAAPGAKECLSKTIATGASLWRLAADVLCRSGAGQASIRRHAAIPGGRRCDGTHGMRLWVMGAAILLKEGREPRVRGRAPQHIWPAKRCRKPRNHANTATTKGSTQMHDWWQCQCTGPLRLRQPAGGRHSRFVQQASHPHLAARPPSLPPPPSGRDALLAALTPDEVTSEAQRPPLMVPSGQTAAPACAPRAAARPRLGAEPAPDMPVRAPRERSSLEDARDTAGEAGAGAGAVARPSGRASKSEPAVAGMSRLGLSEASTCAPRCALESRTPLLTFISAARASFRFWALRSRRASSSSRSRRSAS